MDDNLECRICLEKINPQDGVNIFKTSIDNGKILSDVFLLLFSIEVSSDDQLPELVCPKCVLGIELSLSLRNQAIKSNQTLRNKYTTQIVIDPSDWSEEDINKNPGVKCEKEVEISESFMDEDSSSESTADDTDAVSFILNCVKNKENSQSDIKVETKAKKENSERKYQCMVCEKKFIKRTNLTDHLRIHAGLKSFGCEICGKSFTQYGNLKAHIRCHTKEKPYHCGECGKSYTQSSALTIHMRSHTNERTYVCDICNKAFTNSSDLGKHKKVHKQVKDYACKECKKQFTQKVHAQKHIKKIHPSANIMETLLKNQI